MRPPPPIQHHRPFRAFYAQAGLAGQIRRLQSALAPLKRGGGDDASEHLQRPMR